MIASILKRIRNEHRFKMLWEAAVSCANILDLNKPKLPRKRKVPSRFDGSGAHYHPSKPEDTYRQVFYEAIDCVLMGLTTRFEPSQTTQHLSKVEEFVIGVSDVSYVQKF